MDAVAPPRRIPPPPPRPIRPPVLTPVTEPQPLAPAATLHLRPWPDPLCPADHDPRSWYAETFWLPTLGPTCLLLLRRVADGFDRSPAGFTVPATALSAALGVGERDAKGAPLRKALRRLEQFRLATPDPADGAVLVRPRVPSIRPKHIHRLPEVLRALHHEWSEEQLVRPADHIARSNARRCALDLLALGTSPDSVERTLGHLGFADAIARDSVAWATQHHLRAHAPRAAG